MCCNLHHCTRYVVVLFYPMDWSFVCPTEIVEFSDRIDDFREENCEVSKL